MGKNAYFIKTNGAGIYKDNGVKIVGPGGTGIYAGGLIRVQ
jgi:hypothetical protein